MRIAIVGNGIIGLLLAQRLLAERTDAGLEVALIGPADRPGCGTLAAAAMLNALGEVEADTLADPAGRERLAYGLAATALWPALLDELEVRSGLDIRRGLGTHVIANRPDDAREAAAFEAIAAACPAFGARCEAVDPGDIPGYDPADGRNGVRALHLPDEGWLDPLGLVAALEAIVGADPRCRTIDARAIALEVEAATPAVRLDDGGRIEADAIAACPGSGFAALVEASGLAGLFPRVRHGVGVTILLDTPSDPLAGCIRTPARPPALGLYAVPQTPTATLVGATNAILDDPAAHDPAANAATLARTAGAQLHRQHADARVLAVRVGWRAISDDGLPLLGRTAVPGLVAATGMNRDGLHCAPLIARQLAAALVGDGDDAPPPRYRPDRA